ncbi:DNA repair protein XRCC4-like isoform X3 [Pomacea canaliculata]|uniref:DNA repair protein XRCC4-like isoform X3 n=1 Tax=Pomacea canaliculata TaxID=400727 RepID=UPI000D7260F0|nr:DNA repair protein XRCC4-like isoform X3 [Pomacea canaliculata]
MDTSFVKLQLTDWRNKTCFLLTRLKSEGKEGLHLMLTDGEQFWEGELTEEDLDSLSSNLKMDFNSYVGQTVMALTKPHSSEFSFAYHLKQQAEGVVDFLWKKAATEDIKILMGSVLLHSQTDAVRALAHIFDACIGSAEELHNRIHSLETENQRLSQERQNALKRLEKCVSAKEELERDLYSKFVTVLNSKKAKIRALKQGDEEIMDVIEETSNTSSRGQKSRVNKTSSTVNLDKSLPGDDSPYSNNEEDRAGDTDDEKPAKKKRGPVDQSAGDGESSLVLGDDGGNNQEKEKRVTRPVRNRGRGKQPLARPARTVLPKLSSLSSGVGSRYALSRTSNRSNMRKSGSGQLDRSGDNLDTDDLLNDF